MLVRLLTISDQRKNRCTLRIRLLTETDQRKNRCTLCIHLLTGTDQRKSTATRFLTEIYLADDVTVFLFSIYGFLFFDYLLSTLLRHHFLA